MMNKRKSVHSTIRKGDTVRLKSTSNGCKGNVLGVKGDKAIVEFKGKRVCANISVKCIERV